MFIFEVSDAGCDIDTFWSPKHEDTIKYDYPLHQACRDGNIDQVIRLLSHVSNAPSHEGGIPRIVFKEDPFYGWTPAHWAAYFGNLDCLRQITQVSRHVDVPNSKFMQTPAHIAAFAGHPHCLQWLLDVGADPGRRDYLGETPLHKSARSGSNECVMLLISRGARASTQSSAGLTANQVAESAGHVHVAEVLRNELIKCQISMSKSKVPLHRGNSVSNGYYGYQPNTAQADCDMIVEDVLLNSDVSQNKRTVGGRKRSREVTYSQSDYIKRLKMDAFQNAVPTADSIPHSKCMIGYFL